MSTRFASERYPRGICDRCGFGYPLKKLRFLTIKHKQVNLRVCNECWEPDNVRLFLGEVPVFDPQALRNPRPDTNLAESRSLFSWNPVATQTISTQTNKVRVVV